MSNTVSENRRAGNADVPSLAEFDRMLAYDPETGLFTWIAQRQKVRVGAIAGWTSKYTGYVEIGVAPGRYYAHRLAWLFVHGGWPPNEINHINGVPFDNRIANLRLATRSENLHNVRRRRDNASGFKGVCWCARDGKWRATIMIDGQQRHLGRFAAKEEAAAAYRTAAETHFGAFARVE